jgi:hypothetical protein
MRCVCAWVLGVLVCFLGEFVGIRCVYVHLLDLCMHCVGCVSMCCWASVWVCMGVGCACVCLLNGVCVGYVCVGVLAVLVSGCRVNLCEGVQGVCWVYLCVFAGYVCWMCFCGGVGCVCE